MGHSYDKSVTLLDEENSFNFNNIANVLERILFVIRSSGTLDVRFYSLSFKDSNLNKYIIERRISQEKQEEKEAVNPEIIEVFSVPESRTIQLRRDSQQQEYVSWIMSNLFQIRLEQSSHHSNFKSEPEVFLAEESQKSS